MCSCADLPENYFSYNEPTEQNMNIDLLMQFHDYLNSTNKFHQEYQVSSMLYNSGVGGYITLTIDKSFFDYAKKYGKGNYPNYDKWIMMNFKDCINQSRVSKNVICDLTEFTFQ
jgi:hypothetical protein